MTEIIISIAAKVSEHLVNLTIRQGQYLFRVNKIMKNLQSEKKALASTHDRIQKRADEATHKAEKVNDAVSTWLNEAMELIKEVEQLEQEGLVHSSSCFRGRFPTMNGYNLCKQMEEKTEAMIQLNKRCQFEPFSLPAPIPDIEHFSSGNFEYFKSTRLAADQLLEALQDDSGYIIGLYGMGGSGKTTLVKEVGKKAKELKLFDRVVFTTVSQSPNVMKIQDEISDFLGLKLDEKSGAGKARRISVRLQSGERILIILDDVWTKLNLEDIGIPVDGNIKGCKVLLTTRRQEVCNLMDCLKRIPLDLLSEEEAWSLFQKYAGIDAVISSKLQENVQLQREVCKECKGLPIAIVTVGSSLKGRSSAVDEWKVALQSLRDSKPVDVDEGVGDAFNCLKLSYDYLRRDGIKLLFLICSMFPEDHEILVDDLIKYGVGLGICEGSFDSASDRLRMYINRLVDSCLLMHCGMSKVDQILRHKKDHVRMHDMVRDVALWIASKDRAIIVNLARSLNASMDSGAIEDCYALSSWYNNGIYKSLHRLFAPKLQILLINHFAHTTPLGFTGSLEFSNELFQGLKELKVLALINQNYVQKLAISFPQSLQMLTNLQTLRLVGWDLGDISFVVSLKRLRILDLQHSKFKELPNGITMLDNLKLLDLSQCRIDEPIFEVIRRCSQLEELYAINNGDFSSPKIVDNDDDDDDVTFPNLQTYKLYLGPRMSCPSELHAPSKRLLYVNGFNPSASDAFLKYLLQRTLDVCLYGLHGECKNIFPATVQAVGCMSEMTHLQLNFCSELECLVDSTSNSADKILLDATLPKLVELCLKNMDTLKELWRGPFLHCFFEKLQILRMVSCNQLHCIFPWRCNMQNLKKLSIFKCQTLTYVFPMSVARTLVKLEYLTIKECSELRYIINNEQEDGTDTEEEVTVNIPYNSHEILPKLREITISSCGKLEFILPNSCVEALLQLRKIHISLASKLKYIFGQCNNGDQLSYLNRAKVVLPHLEDIELQSLPDLLGIFSGNYYHLSWEFLKKLTWRNCPKMSTNSCHNNLNFALEHQQLPPNTETHLGKECLVSKLEKLSLLNVHDLRFIWTASTLTQTLRLQHLQNLTVSRCRKLKSIFPSVIQRCLPELKELYIGNCDVVEEIIAENEKYDDDDDDDLSITQACFPKLTRIEVRRCSMLRSLFSTSIARNLPQLSSLIIVDARQLKKIFGHGNEEDPVDEEPLIFQNLKELRLEELKSLVDVGIMLPSKELCKIRIHECPNIGSSIVYSASSGNRGTTDESNK